MGRATIKNREKLCDLCGAAWRDGQRPHCWVCGLTVIIYRKFGTGQTQASSAIAKEIKQGRMLPASHYHCVDCNKQAADWDHRDYNKPLDVVPVCRSCNLLRGYGVPKRMTFAEFWSLAHKFSAKRRLSIEHFEPLRRRYWPNEQGSN